MSILVPDDIFEQQRCYPLYRQGSATCCSWSSCRGYGCHSVPHARGALSSNPRNVRLTKIGRPSFSRGRAIASLNWQFGALRASLTLMSHRTTYSVPGGNPQTDRTAPPVCRCGCVFACVGAKRSRAAQVREFRRKLGELAFASHDSRPPKHERHMRQKRMWRIDLIGATGFEPATSWSRI